MSELWRSTAREMVAKLRSGEVSPSEAVEAAFARIEAVEPRLNAIPTLCEERARRQAKRIEAGELTPPADGRGWLAGLPVVANPVSPWKHVTGTRVWRAHGASNRKNSHIPSTNISDGTSGMHSRPADLFNLWRWSSTRRRLSARRARAQRS